MAGISKALAAGLVAALLLSACGGTHAESNGTSAVKTYLNDVAAVANLCNRSVVSARSEWIESGEIVRKSPVSQITGDISPAAHRALVEIAGKVTRDEKACRVTPTSPQIAAVDNPPSGPEALNVGIAFVFGYWEPDEVTTMQDVSTNLTDYGTNAYLEMTTNLVLDSQTADKESKLLQYEFNLAAKQSKVVGYVGLRMAEWNLKGH